MIHAGNSAAVALAKAEAHQLNEVLAA